MRCESYLGDPFETGAYAHGATLVIGILIIVHVFEPLQEGIE